MYRSSEYQSLGRSASSAAACGSSGISACLLPVAVHHKEWCLCVRQCPSLPAHSYMALSGNCVQLGRMRLLRRIAAHAAVLSLQGQFTCAHAEG